MFIFAMPFAMPFAVPSVMPSALTFAMPGDDACRAARGGVLFSRPHGQTSISISASVTLIS